LLIKLCCGNYVEPTGATIHYSDVRANGSDLLLTSSSYVISVEDSNGHKTSISMTSGNQVSCLLRQRIHRSLEMSTDRNRNHTRIHHFQPLSSHDLQFGINNLPHCRQSCRMRSVVPTLLTLSSISSSLDCAVNFAKTSGASSVSAISRPSDVSRNNRITRRTPACMAARSISVAWKLGSITGGAVGSIEEMVMEASSTPVATFSPPFSSTSTRRTIRHVHGNGETSFY
jgi:hypothetical protein